MSVDLSHVARAAVEAALDEGNPRRRRLTGLRAVVLGAALGTAARVAVARAPLPDFARLPDLVRDRLADRGLLPDDEDFDEVEEEEPEAEGSDEEPEADAEPQSEEEPEVDEEPQADEEPEGDEEPRAEEPEPDSEGDETPDLLGALSGDRPARLSLVREGGGRRRVRPARRAPKPPKSAEDRS